MTTARRVCEPIVDGTRCQDDYPYSPAGSFDESIGHDLFWNEVWIGDENGLFSGVDREKKKHVILEAAAQRRTLDDLCLRCSRMIKTWKIVVPSNSDPGRFKPALGKCGLQKANYRAFDSHISIAPVLRHTSITCPCVTNSIAAGESDSTVYYQNATVAPVIVTQQTPWKNDSVRFDLTKIFD